MTANTKKSLTKIENINVKLKVVIVKDLKEDQGGQDKMKEELEKMKKEAKKRISVLEELIVKLEEAIEISEGSIPPVKNKVGRPKKKVITDAEFSMEEDKTVTRKYIKRKKHKKGMSKVIKKKISKANKKRWAERKAEKRNKSVFWNKQMVNYMKAHGVKKTCKKYNLRAKQCYDKKYSLNS